MELQEFFNKSFTAVSVFGLLIVFFVAMVEVSRYLEILNGERALIVYLITFTLIVSGILLYVFKRIKKLEEIVFQK